MKLSLWVTVLGSGEERQVMLDPQTSMIVAIISSTKPRFEVLEELGKLAVDIDSLVTLVRFEEVEEELRFCPTCGSTSEVDGDCPHCNPPVA